MMNDECVTKLSQLVDRAEGYRSKIIEAGAKVVLLQRLFCFYTDSDPGLTHSVSISCGRRVDPTPL
jgi:hypothetical protein